MPFQATRRFTPVACALILSACGGASGPFSGLGGSAASNPGAGLDRPPFSDATTELGVDFIHINGLSGQRHFPEINGPGSFLFDYDGDGDLDLYLIQGGDLSAGPDPSVTDRLYRNRLVEDGRLAFEDVTAASGLAASGYGMGGAVGDIDNDGDLDIYLANFGPNQLWANNGDGTFTDITSEAGAGIDDPRWSTSAAFFDYDRDGYLDLFVASYTNFTLETHKTCYSITGATDYCGPASYQAEPDRLLRNRGDGSFENVTAEAGIGAAFGPGLGVATGDFNADGWLDVYVANDLAANQLWTNQAGVRFENSALTAGVAYNADGAAEAGMGIAANDLDNDLDLDLFVTHLTEETNTFYANQGDGVFDDQTVRWGLAAPSLPFTSFGVAATDVDGDSWLDLLIANGAVRVESRGQRGESEDPLDVYRQANQLFLYRDGTFVDASQAAMPDLGPAEVARGLAIGDLDNDGDPDAVFNNNGGPPRVLVNQLGPAETWVGVRLIDRHGRDAYGATVLAQTQGDRALFRRVSPDGSHLSSSDPRLLLALPADSELSRLTVSWPDGMSEWWDWSERSTSAYVEIVQGSGQVE